MQAHTKLLTFCLMAAMVLGTTSSMAQAGPGRGAATNARAHKGTNRLAVDADHAAMQAVAKELGKASKIMKSALPIYSGHRHKSIEISKLAIGELRDAYKWQPNQAAKPSNISQELAKIGNGNETDARRYSAEQIARSNEKMKAALEILVKAQNDITKIHGSYGGNIGNASQLIAMAINEANQALQSVSRK